MYECEIYLKDGTVYQGKFHSFFNLVTTVSYYEGNYYRIFITFEED